MFAASDVVALRQKRLIRTTPWLFQHLRRCMVHDQQDEVKLKAYTDDQAEVLHLFLPHPRRPYQTRTLVLKHDQWQPLQDLLEAKGFAVNISANHLTITAKTQPTPTAACAAS